MSEADLQEAMGISAFGDKRKVCATVPFLQPLAPSPHTSSTDGHCDGLAEVERSMPVLFAARQPPSAHPIRATVPFYCEVFFPQGEAVQLMFSSIVCSVFCMDLEVYRLGSSSREGLLSPVASSEPQCLIVDCTPGSSCAWASQEKAFHVKRRSRRVHRVVQAT